MSSRQTGRTSKQLIRALERARDEGLITLFFSHCDMAREAHVHRAAELARGIGMDHALHRPANTITVTPADPRTGPGSVVFMTLRRLGDEYVRPSTVSALNRDTRMERFRGFSNLVVRLDHHAQYVVERDERRANFREASNG